MKKMKKKAQGFLLILVVLSLIVLGFIFYTYYSGSSEKDVDRCLNQNTPQNNHYVYTYHFFKGWVCESEENIVSATSEENEKISVGDCIDVTGYDDKGITTYCKVVAGYMIPISLELTDGVQAYSFPLEDSCKTYHGFDEPTRLESANSFHGHKVDRSLCQ